MPASTRVGLFLAAIFAASAITSAYLPPYLADRGWTASTIGEVLGIGALLRVVVVPLWGWGTDRLGRYRLMLLAGAAVAFACAAMMPGAAVPAALVTLVVVGGIAGATLPPLTDALTLALAASGRLDYGRTRAWGSVAYMAASGLGGAVLGRFGTAAVPAMLAIGYGAAAALTRLLPTAERMPHARPLHTGPLGRVFGVTVLATALIQGSHAAYYAFATLYWRSAGIADAVIGLLIAESIVVEIALFVWGRRLVERIGPAGLSAIAASAGVLRWLMMAWTVSAPVLVAVQLLHAATFACQHLSSMLVLRTLPPARAGLAQTVLSSLGFSAPTGALIWISGLVYARSGGDVFLLMAGLSALALPLVPFLPGAARRR